MYKYLYTICPNSGSLTQQIKPGQIISLGTHQYLAVGYNNRIKKYLDLESKSAFSCTLIDYWARHRNIHVYDKVS